MRTKFVFVVFVPLLCFLAVLYLFLDGWIEAGLESTGEALVGARVEIDDLRLTLVPIGIKFSRLQVADPREPFTNTVETGTVAFKLDFGQLLRGKHIIETMEVNNLILGSNRETDGSLPQRKIAPGPAVSAEALPSAVPPLTAEMDSITAEKKKEAPLFDPARLRSFVNIDSLLDTGNLATLRHIDSLTQQVRQADLEWKTTLAEMDKSREKVAEIEQRVKVINVNELKSLPAITEAVKNADAVRKDVTALSSAFQTRKESVVSSIDRLNNSLRSIDDMMGADFENLLRAARLPDVSMRGLAELLLGPEVFQKAGEYLLYVDFARENVRNSPTPEKTSPPRLQGQDIHFPSDRAYPKFWIKRIHVSGGTDHERNPNYFY
ncbi:MAG: TIGR03545 family protein, partial [Ignavibacteriales bacterium]|nr:TIGR03545 family protein [Ignavibacteriales bacterium]